MHQIFYARDNNNADCFTPSTLVDPKIIVFSNVNADVYEHATIDNLDDDNESTVCKDDNESHVDL